MESILKAYNPKCTADVHFTSWICTGFLQSVSQFSQYSEIKLYPLLVPYNKHYNSFCFQCQKYQLKILMFIFMTQI